MAYIACILHLALTVAFPLKLTYESVANQKKDMPVWGVYWLFFFLIGSIQ